MVLSVPQALVSVHLPGQTPHQFHLPKLLPLQHSLLEHHCDLAIPHNRPHLAPTSPGLSQHFLQLLSTHGNPLQISSRRVYILRVPIRQTHMELFHLNRLPSPVMVRMLPLA